MFSSLVLLGRAIVLLWVLGAVISLTHVMRIPIAPLEAAQIKGSFPTWIKFKWYMNFVMITSSVGISFLWPFWIVPLIVSGRRKSPLGSVQTESPPSGFSEPLTTSEQKIRLDQIRNTFNVNEDLISTPLYQSETEALISRLEEAIAAGVIPLTAYQLPPREEMERLLDR